ncbi:ClpXP protease specificity-enhancing factor [Agarivorans sp. MS3-6]|uniref:ClpXP protease specificity-enhancing factor n=1 Tax=Agarivorans sp. TSD2052 TaxID=2937286 RepID=UPI00200D51A3|nr:ClpXP protease specificity-enhancing factor [Agarivorans sp. TSD2052]UPW17955.1 ClpXP protease specificity-enhancing factor [Agarivorans sp. TSD2052]
MSPNRPYLLRAFFDWLLDNELTPHLVVDATQANVTVPSQFVNDGQIVLNIAPSAVVSFDMDLHHVGFNARFGGKPFQVYVPMAAVIAIYARENGAGTAFEPEAAYEAIEPVESDDKIVESPSAEVAKKPTLTIVK